MVSQVQREVSPGSEASEIGCRHRIAIHIERGLSTGLVIGDRHMLPLVVEHRVRRGLDEVIAASRVGEVGLQHGWPTAVTEPEAHAEIVGVVPFDDGHRAGLEGVNPGFNAQPLVCAEIERFRGGDGDEVLPQEGKGAVQHARLEGSRDRDT